MTLEKWIAGTIVAVIVAAAGVGFALTPHWEVQRDTRVPASPDAVLAYLADLHSWQEWSVWNKQRFPRAEFEYGGPARGVGANQVWNDGDVRTVWTITAYQPGQSLSYTRVTGGGSPHYGRFEASADAGGTRLVWTTWGDTGINPFERLVAQVYLSGIAANLEHGLARIRAHFGAGGSGA